MAWVAVNCDDVDAGLAAFAAQHHLNDGMFYWIGGDVGMLDASDSVSDQYTDSLSRAGTLAPGTWGAKVAAVAGNGQGPFTVCLLQE